MERLNFQTLSPIEAFRIFRTSPGVAEQIISEASHIADTAQRGEFNNGDEAQAHAELLFQLAYVFQCTTSQAEYFKELKQLESKNE